jgi:cytochrome P450
VDKHHIRRKLWDNGFTGKALADYKPEILEFCDKAVRNVNAVVARKAATGTTQTIDMGLQSSYFSFDVMGVLGFGEPFGMMDAGAKHNFVITLENAMQSLIPFHEISWIRILLRKLMPLPERLKVFEQQNTERFERREKQGSARRDLFTYLLGEEKEDSGNMFKLTRLELIADTGTIVVAGSDTTSSLLTWFWYYSTKYPETYKILRAELAGLTPDQLVDTTLLSKLPYLNAALNETMRMQPAVPGGLRRLVPQGGVEIEGHYIPEDTAVSIPGYAIQHDPRWWGDDCDTYRPERWLDTTGKYNKSAYLPFSYGSRACPGKGLAMVEARLVVAQVASRFEFAFPPGFNQQEFEAGVRDHFTIQNKELPLVPIPSPVGQAA